MDWGSLRRRRRCRSATLDTPGCSTPSWSWWASYLSRVGGCDCFFDAAAAAGGGRGLGPLVASADGGRGRDYPRRCGLDYCGTRK